MNQKILGLKGKKKCGKDAACTIIQELAPDTLRLAFADPLKNELADVCGVHRADIDEHKDFFRPMLQYWGTEVRRKQDSTYWIDQTEKAIHASSAPLIVVTDVRFPNEAAMLKRLAGRIVNIVRPVQVFHEAAKALHPLPPMDYRVMALNNFMSSLPVDSRSHFIAVMQESMMATSDGHSSETSMDNYESEFVVRNFGTIEDLRDQVRVLLSKI